MSAQSPHQVAAFELIETDVSDLIVSHAVAGRHDPACGDPPTVMGNGQRENFSMIAPACLAAKRTNGFLFLYISDADELVVTGRDQVPSILCEEGTINGSHVPAGIEHQIVRFVRCSHLARTHY